MNTDNTADNVYARELGKRGQGYPLWVPEPQDGCEVEIGDVGYISRGGFYRLFRATEDGTHDLNKTHGVPAKFEKFPIGNLAPKRLDNAIPKGLLGSQSVKHLAIDGQVTAYSAELAFKCEVTDDQGAFLVLGASATRQELHQIRKMKNHMGLHVRNWYTFACEMGLEVAEEDIIFVRGWVKTTEWMVAAFTQQGKSAQISISADGGAVASGHLRLEAAHHASPTFDYRSGPESQKTLNNQKNRGGAKQGNSKGKGRARHQESNSSQPEKNQALAMNQCVFLHYLKLKRRFLGMKFMEAMAEPRDPSFEGDDHHFEQVPAPVKRYDPVDYLLDYILENSDAEVAVASDGELIDICKAVRPEETEFPIPDDIPAFLRNVSPQVEVTEDGIGILSLEDITSRQQFEETPSGEQVDNTSMDVGDGAAQDATTDPPPAPANPNEQVDRMDEDDGTKEDLGKKFETSDYLLELSINEQRGGISALAYSPNGRYAAGGFDSGSIVIWDPQTRRRVAELQGHNDTICCLAFSPDNLELVSGSRDARLIIWNIRDEYQRAILVGHHGFVNSVVYSPDGKTIASASIDYTVRLWDVETGRLKATSDEHDAMVMLVKYSPDSSRLVSASADCVARILDARNASTIAELDSHEGVIYSVCFSPDGRRIATTSDDGSVRIWSALTGDEYLILHEHKGSVWDAIFTPDGKRIISVGSEKAVKVCDSFDGTVLSQFDGDDGLLNAATFSPDSKFVAAGSADHQVCVWNTESGQCVARWSGHADNISRLQFSADSKHILSASDDGTVRLFNMRNAFVPVQQQ